MAGVLHIATLFSIKILTNFNTEEKWSFLLKILKFWTEKVISTLTFGYYIRAILEINEFLLFSSAIEIYNFSTSDILQKNYLTIALVSMLWCLAIIAILALLSISSYEVKEDEHNKIGELFSGVKMNTKWKLYIPLLLARRTFFVITLVMLVTVSSRTVIIVLSVVQFFYACCIVFMRLLKRLSAVLLKLLMNSTFSSF